MRYGITKRPSMLLLTRRYQTHHLTGFRGTSLTIYSPWHATCGMIRWVTVINYFWLIVEFGCGKNHMKTWTPVINCNYASWSLLFNAVGCGQASWLFPSIHEHHVPQQRRFIAAPCHRIQVVRKCFEDHSTDFRRIVWPENLPDMT